MLMTRIAAKLKDWDDRRTRTDEIDRRVAAQAASARNRLSHEQGPSLNEIISQAWTSGQDIDLSDVGYGPVHWQSEERFLSSPAPYYFFLGGLVRSQGCKRIFEIGTHYGGSTQAISRGIVNSSDATIVTVDITDLNPDLHAVGGITKLNGDANSEYILQRVMLAFGGEPVDLIFIDGDHRFLPAITNFGLYSSLLQPRFVVIDDIVLNDGMRAMWDVICASYGAEAVNCVDVTPGVRSSACGFGLVRLR